MISRDCQKYFLNLIYEYTSAENKLDSPRSVLWSRILRPAYYIDIFKVFISSKKEQKGEENWIMDLDDLKILLEDLEIKFKWEELKPLCGLISKSWSRERITFLDFLNFILPDVESVDLIKKKLADIYRNELSKTLGNYGIQKNFEKKIENEMFNKNGYNFDINTFEIKLEDEDEIDANLPLLKQKNKKFGEEKSRKSFNTMKRAILIPIRKIFQTELKNFRHLKIRSRLVSDDPSFKRRRLFQMIDFEKNGVISYKNLKQFTIKHGKPIRFKKLKYLYRRMKLNIQEKITFREFTTIFFDCYNAQQKKERHYYNFYYKRDDDRRLKVKLSQDMYTQSGVKWITGFKQTRGIIQKGQIHNGEFYKDSTKKNFKDEIDQSDLTPKKNQSILWSSSRTSGGTMRLKQMVKINSSKKRSKTVKPRRKIKAYSLLSHRSISINSLSSIQINDVEKRLRKNSNSRIQKTSHQNSVLKNLNLRISPVKKEKIRLGILSRTRRKMVNLKECLKRLSVYFKYLSTSEAKICQLRYMMEIEDPDSLVQTLHHLFGKGDRLSLFSIQKGLAEKLLKIVENGEIKLILARVGSKVKMKFFFKILF